MRESKRNSGKPHVGPGQCQVTLYIREELWESFKVRAKSLGRSGSARLRELMEQDLADGGPAVIKPVARAGATGAASNALTLEGLAAKLERLAEAVERGAVQAQFDATRPRRRGARSQRLAA